MNPYRKSSISVVVTALLLCGNAFAKKDEVPPILDVIVVGDETPPKTQPVNACADLTVLGAAINSSTKFPPARGW